MPAVFEPSTPSERKAQAIPPKKSYAAVTAPSGNPNHLDDSSKAKPVKGRPFDSLPPLNIEKAEYTGTGLDASPRSPTRGHKRMSSKMTNGSKPKNADSDRKTKDNNEDSKLGIIDTEMMKTTGDNADNVVVEKFPEANGVELTSIKQAAEYHDKRLGDKRLPRRKSELVSGRRAGAGWQKSSIRFAPLNVPLQRRLQTLMVLMHTLSIVGWLTLFFWLCSIPLLWPILLPYLIYVLFSHAATSGTLAFRNERLRRSKVWSLYASYFPARLHRSEELPPTRKYIFGYHPHGIISHGAFAAFATEALGFSQLFPGITNSLLTLDSNFRIPLYRDYALRMGLASVSRESIENILSKGGTNGEGMGRAVTIVVGGARESLDARPNSLQLVLARRKGFVKLAIRNGADLVPVLGFGENDLYDQFDAAKHPMIHKFQLLVKKIAGFTVPLFHARGVFNYDVGMMPYRRPVNVVVGRPIKVVTQEHPDKEAVDRVHEEYVKELKRIWDDWKDTFAKDRTSEMELVE